MTTTTKIAIGILGAAAAGGIIGLLIAPETGTDMRKRVKKTAGEWVDNLSHMFTEGKAGAEEIADEVKDKAARAKSSAKESFS